MAVVDSGTITASGSEQTFGAGPYTSAGTYVLTVNTENMVNGDRVELRAYMKNLTGDSELRLVQEANYSHVQGDAGDVGDSAVGAVLKQTVPVRSEYSMAFTIKQPAGSARDFDFRVDTL